MQNKSTQKRISRKILAAHVSGEFSYRLDGHWTTRVSILPQAAYLALLRHDPDQIGLEQFSLTLAREEARTL